MCITTFSKIVMHNFKVLKIFKISSIYIIIKRKINTSAHWYFDWFNLQCSTFGQRFHSPYIYRKRVGLSSTTLLYSGLVDNFSISSKNWYQVPSKTPFINNNQPGNLTSLRYNRETPKTHSDQKLIFYNTNVCSSHEEGGILYAITKESQYLL